MPAKTGKALNLVQASRSVIVRVHCGYDDQESVMHRTELHSSWSSAQIDLMRTTPGMSFIDDLISDQ